MHKPSWLCTSPKPLLLALQTLHAMLEREVWRRLPLVSGPLPSVLAALEGAAAAAPPAAFDPNDFGAWVARGNPWREPAHEDGEDGEAAAELEASGRKGLCGASAGAEREDDEEAAELYGESIDEESQRVRVRAGAPRHGDDSAPIVTNASWRLARCAHTAQVPCPSQLLAQQPSCSALPSVAWQQVHLDAGSTKPRDRLRVFPHSPSPGVRGHSRKQALRCCWQHPKIFGDSSVWIGRGWPTRIKHCPAPTLSPSPQVHTDRQDAGGLARAGAARTTCPDVLIAVVACRWLAEYAQLMRILRADAGRVWSGAAELFELYFLHTYATFADVGLMDVLGRGSETQQGPGIQALCASLCMLFPAQFDVRLSVVMSIALCASIT